MKIIRQHDQCDCGASCLAMVAAWYGKKLSIPRCRELTKTNNAGTNLYGLAEGGKRLGLESAGLFGDMDELLSGIKSSEIPMPFIAHITTENTMLHFVVVFSLKEGTFIIGDPAKGKRRLSMEEFAECWTGYIVTYRKTDQFQPGNENCGKLSKFFRLLEGQYKKLAGILVLSLTVAAIGIAGAFVFEAVMDQHKFYGGINSRSLQSLDVIFVSLILLYLLQTIIQFVRGRLIISLSKKIDLRLSLSYYNHLMDLPLLSVTARQTGDYLSRLSETDSIRNVISGAAVTMMMDSIMALASGYILYLEGGGILFLIVLLMTVSYMALVMLFRRPIEQANYKVMEGDAGVQSFFKESIDGIETLKASSACEQIKEISESKYRDYLDRVVKNARITLSSDVLCQAVELIGTVLVLWIGFVEVFSGQLTTGRLMTFYAMLAYFTSPIKNLAQLQPEIQTALVAADRLSDILDLPTEETSDGKPFPQVFDWEMRNVNFRYGNQEPILKDVDLHIKRGEKIALLGTNGCGKTTLVKLFLRLYDPEKGDIMINGQKIETFSLDELRKNIAYVSQNTFLFSNTIKNNLKLGNPDVTDDEIIQACEISQAASFIETFPLGYDTPIEENGSNLSGGQKQCLAIARALLKKPQLLILDEATSQIDSQTEERFRKALNSMENCPTCIMIAHRMSAIRDCNRIYVMDKGKIAEKIHA